MFGNVSHRTWQEYDVVAIVASILPELYNFPSVLSFNGIPLGYNERMENKDIPYIITGGVCSPMADILYGKVSATDHCLVDGTYVGHAEKHLNDMLEIIIDEKFSRGMLSKRDVLKRIANSMDCFYVPAEYDFDWSLDPEYGYKINKITPNKGYPKHIHFSHIPNDMRTPGFERKILETFIS